MLHERLKEAIRNNEDLNITQEKITQASQIRFDDKPKPDSDDLDIDINDTKNDSVSVVKRQTKK